MNLGDDVMFRSQKTRFRCLNFAGRFSLLLLLLVFATTVAGAQSLVWTDHFVQGSAPTEDQCRNWGSFLDQLAGKRFASVTLSGEFDLSGRTIDDPEAATELARLLATKTPGVVVSGGHTWSVTNCQLSRCNDGFSISLSVDGSQEECLCTDTYTIRPQSPNQDWGGINTGTSCNARSQWMKLEFGSAVTVTASGPTDLCLDGSVILTADAVVCSESVDYLWSNGETTPSILVTEAGTYTVTVSDRTSACSATSLPVEVTLSNPVVNAGEDVITCDEPVQLNAIVEGTSAGDDARMVNSACLFDAPGGSPGMCNFQRSSICLERTMAVIDDEFKHTVSFVNPVELRYKLYYVATQPADFILKVNGQPVATFREANVNTVCYPLDGTTMPKTVVVSPEVFRPHWKEDMENELSVEVISSGTGIHIGGLVAEVVTSGASYSWSPAAGLNTAFVRNPIATPTTSTVYTVTYTDVNGCVASDDVKVTVQCIDPTPVAMCKELTRTLEEGCEVIVLPAEFDDGSTSPTGATLHYTVEPAGPYSVGTTDVVFTVTDDLGQSSSCQTKITVTDEILPVINMPRDTTVTSDPGESWATLELPQPEASDNCEVKSIVNDFDGTVFPQGETIVTWTVTDIHGNESSAQQKVTVTVPSAIGSITGGGWFNSPQGAYFANPRVSGKATFAFHASNMKPGRAPEGHVVFHFKNARIKFHSTAIDAINIQDERASIEAAGRLNGLSDYRIFISVATQDKDHQKHWGDKDRKGHPHNKHDKNSRSHLRDDARHDKHPGKKGKGHQHDHWKATEFIRVQISDPSGVVVYDTQADDPNEAIATTPIGGGTIKVIEKEEWRKVVDEIADVFERKSDAWPNPFSEWLDVTYKSSSNHDVNIKLLDLSGKAVYDKVFPAKEDGHYAINMADAQTNRPGIYMLVIRQGLATEILRVVRK